MVMGRFKNVQQITYNRVKAMSNPRRMEEMNERRWGTRKQNRERKQKVTSLVKKKEGKALLECPWSKEELPDLGCNEVEVEQSL